MSMRLAFETHVLENVFVKGFFVGHISNDAFDEAEGVIIYLIGCHRLTNLYQSHPGCFNCV